MQASTRYRRPDRAGFSLLEMLTVMVMFGIMTLIALPRIDRALSRRDVSAAKVELSNLLLRAKVAAVSARRPTTLTVASNTAYVTRPDASGALEYVSGALVFQSTGVTAVPTGSSLVIQPTGLVTSGTPFTVRLSKGGATDSVVVTGYGRVQ